MWTILVLCIWGTSVGFSFCLSSHLFFCQLLISNKWHSYMSPKLNLLLELNINRCFIFFRNLHENLERDNGIRFCFELTFSAVINTEVIRFEFQTTLSAQPGVGNQIMSYSNLRRVWLFELICATSHRKLFLRFSKMSQMFDESTT